jgi:multimeric flavodoxin WrbA
MAKNGVTVEVLRAVDHDIATGVWPDMTEHGWPSDAWPGIYQRVLAADILVLAGPIWLADNSSVMKRVIERLYACSHLLNDAGQYAYYGRVVERLYACSPGRAGRLGRRPGRCVPCIPGSGPRCSPRPGHCMRA